MLVRFVAIDVVDSVDFTLQDQLGARFAFTQPFDTFEDFVTRAAALVRPTVVLTDTDQLLGLWFDLPCKA